MTQEFSYLVFNDGQVLTKDCLEFIQLEKIDDRVAFGGEAASILSKLSRMDRWPKYPTTFIELVNNGQLFYPTSKILTVEDMDKIVIPRRYTEGFILMTTGHNMFKRDKPVTGPKLDDDPSKGYVFTPETARVLITACNEGFEWAEKITKAVRAVYDPTTGVRTIGDIFDANKLNQI